jgi:uncharacterized cofD-like protein
LLENGKVIAGETRISATRVRIRRVRLVPRKVKPVAEVLKAIAAADLILLGPGSLFTSIIPNLLVSGISEALEKSTATRIYVANLMTQPGETLGYTLVDHVRAIHQHTGRPIIDWVVINNQPLAPDVLRRYKSQDAEPVVVDQAELLRMGMRCLFDNLLEVHGVVRHNSNRLAALLMDKFVKK